MSIERASTDPACVDSSSFTVPDLSRFLALRRLAVLVSFVALSSGVKAQDMPHRSFRVTGLPEGSVVSTGGIDGEGGEWIQSSTDVTVIRILLPSGRAVDQLVEFRRGTMTELAFEPRQLNLGGVLLSTAVPGALQVREGRFGAGALIGGGVVVGVATVLGTKAWFDATSRDYEDALREYDLATSEVDAVRWREEADASYNDLQTARWTHRAGLTLVAVAYTYGVFDTVRTHLVDRLVIHQGPSYSIGPDPDVPLGVAMRIPLYR